jgi:hypothetical protein
MFSIFKKSKNHWTLQPGNLDAVDWVICDKNFEQPLLVSFLVSLLTAWNLLPFLNEKLVVGGLNKPSILSG